MVLRVFTVLSSVCSRHIYDYFTDHREFGGGAEVWGVSGSWAAFGLVSGGFWARIFSRQCWRDLSDASFCCLFICIIFLLACDGHSSVVYIGRPTLTTLACQWRLTPSPQVNWENPTSLPILSTSVVAAGECVCRKHEISFPGKKNYPPPSFLKSWRSVSQLPPLLLVEVESNQSRKFKYQYDTYQIVSVWM